MWRRTSGLSSFRWEYPHHFPFPPPPPSTSLLHWHSVAKPENVEAIRWPSQVLSYTRPAVWLLWLRCFTAHHWQRLKTLEAGGRHLQQRACNIEAELWIVSSGILMSRQHHRVTSRWRRALNKQKNKHKNVCFFSLQRSGAVWTWRLTWALIPFPVLHPVPNKRCGFCLRTAPWKKKERLFALKPMRLTEAHRNCNGLFLRVVVFVENMVCS